MSAKSLILSLYLLLVAATVNAQYWRQFDNEWIPVTLDDNVSLQFPADPIDAFKIDDPGRKGIGTKKNLTYYYVRCIDGDIVSPALQHFQDSLLNTAHYTPLQTLDSVRQFIYRNYVKEYANHMHTDIAHVAIDIDSIPSEHLLFIQYEKGLEIPHRENIFYCNNKLYILEMIYTKNADHNVINKIWKKYIDSVQVKNKN